MEKRYFYPSKPDKTQVHHWEWTKSKGLWVVYTDGLACKSEYKLRELIEADHTQGCGLPCIERK